jgi:DNA-binding NarL/FixJ family response regulator
MQPLKIVICEDHNITIEGLRVILSAHGNFIVAGHAHNESDLLLTVSEVKPEIVIMDINLGSENGLEIAEKVRKIAPEVRILILTMYESDPILIEKAKQIAHGYLSKSTSSVELVKALNGIMNGGFYENAEARQKRLNGVQKRDEFVVKMRLTIREREIIKLVGLGKSSTVISEQLFLSLHTVRTHKKNIMKKLGLNTTPELVRYAMENNLVK